MLNYKTEGQVGQQERTGDGHIEEDKAQESLYLPSITNSVTELQLFVISVCGGYGNPQVKRGD